MFIKDSINRVRAFRKAKGWSVLRLAKEAGLNEATIRHMDDPGWSPTATTLTRLETVCDAHADKEAA